MVNESVKIPVAFECEGETLIGIITSPHSLSTVRTAVISLPAGGPQYRVGLARQMVKQSELMASHGIATLRFDYRGIGDSDGDFGGFDSVGPDIRAAINCIQEHLPSVKNIVLWGGCNAASAIMMNAWQYENVEGIVVSNPYLGVHDLSERAKWLHRRRRILQLSFWKKLLSGGFGVTSKIRARLNKTSTTKPVLSKVPQNTKNVQFEAAKSSQLQGKGEVLSVMLEGLQKYSGRTLVILNDKSPQSAAFQVLVNSNRPWRQIFKTRKATLLPVSTNSDNKTSNSGESSVQQITIDWMKQHNL